MRNFANGHGFVYNIGGERVEGFTSLLWTLIGSTLYLLSATPEKLLLLLNVILTSFSLLHVVNILDNNSNKITRGSIFFSY